MELEFYTLNFLSFHLTILPLFFILQTGLHSLDQLDLSFTNQTHTAEEEGEKKEEEENQTQIWAN